MFIVLHTGKKKKEKKKKKNEPMITLLIAVCIERYGKAYRP